MDRKFSVAIIGGGVIGCAIAYELARNKSSNVVVLEKNLTIPGINQSSRNGGVVHSGIYYPKDIEPLKAKLCVEGNKNLYAFCQQFGIPCIKTGKLIVATNKFEEEYLHFFFSTGQQNGIKGLELLNSQQAKQKVPNLGKVTLAIFVPGCGLIAIDPYVTKLFQLSKNSGINFLTGCKVINIKSDNNSFTIAVKTPDGIDYLKCEQLINAAGIYSDVVARMVNKNSQYNIEPTRGELAEYDSSYRLNISSNGMHIYPTPFFYYNDTKKVVKLPPDKITALLKKGEITKTLGAHISPIFGSSMMAVGPLKSFGQGREDYVKNLHPLEDYIKITKSIFPNLRKEDLHLRFSGIMSVLKGQADFIIKEDSKYPNCINLIGMDSPALTASLAIAKYTVNLL